MAREGADNVGDVLSASKFYILEQRIRRSRIWNQAKQSEREPLNRVSRGVKAFTNFGYDLISKYAESPGRVALTSSCIIISFSTFYAIMDSELPYNTSLELPSYCVGGLQWSFPNNSPFRPSTYPSATLPELCSPSKISGIEYLSFSLQAFTSFLLPSNSTVSSSSLRILSSFESLLGAFLIGLFVATVVRSIEW